MTNEEDLGPAETGGCGGACGCGGSAAGLPELDGRAIPHAVRQAAIRGALDGLRTGEGLVLVAPHDPVPLLRQIEADAPGGFRVQYLDRGPESWRLAFVRR